MSLSDKLYIGTLGQWIDDDGVKKIKEFIKELKVKFGIHLETNNVKCFSSVQIKLILLLMN